MKLLWYEIEYSSIQGWIFIKITQVVVLDDEKNVALASFWS
jgi:hypothetical protein